MLLPSTEIRVSLEGKKSEGAIACPLDDDDFRGSGDFRFDETRALAQQRDAEAGGLQQDAVDCPGGLEGRFGVVKQVEIAGNSLPGDALVERGIARDVTLIALDTASS
ncbi:MAG: hypothetical protein SF066_11515 [Thermoanaerobaculia bacterium]|nr:hypothetical protein [Thermoanaerobaculia bacterium]